MTPVPVPHMLGESGRVQLRTIALIRWVAIAGQATALLVVHFWLGFELPIMPALFTVGASALVNIALVPRRPAARVDERGAALYLAFDIVQLAVLLYLTGGLENPFAFLLLAPVAISATVLSLTSTLTLCALALVSISMIATWHFPLPWHGTPPHLPQIYVLGIWAALAIGILFFAAYTWRVAEEARHLSQGLAATQLALAREQQTSAIGALAAAAAHELGSPLGTIAVVAGEIARELPDDSPMAEDVDLLMSEVRRCRDILAEIARNRGGDAQPFSRVPLHHVVELVADRHPADGILLELGPAPASADAGPEPLIPLASAMLHGLGNLIQNALQFARGTVNVEFGWDENEVCITIADDGPGFPSSVLERIGEPYISLRSDTGAHMGLGIFIAQTLLQQTGAELSFSNRAGGGAVVAVRWDRAILAASGNETITMNSS
ncbi:MAG: ActS/PrrB/RegB family redox-sensitive histidine kinase [Alphaproteobacteria bacterium]